MLNIMIIDDEKDILEGMKYIINWEQHGYRVKYTFESSRKALAIALQEKPDLIITDIRMPGIDGLQLIAELKKHLKEIKFVILSGYDDFQYAKLAIEYGVNDYLLKPIDEEELINTLQRLKAEIHKEKQKKLTTQSMMRKLEDSKNIIEASAINKVIKGRQDLLEDSEKIIIQKLNNMNSHLVFIKMDRYFTNDGQYKCVNEEGFSVIKNLVVNEYNSIYFFEESQVGIFFIKKKDICIPFLQELQKKVVEVTQNTVSIGVSSFKNIVDNMAANFNIIYDEFKKKVFFGGKNQLYILKSSVFLKETQQEYKIIEKTKQIKQIKEKIRRGLFMLDMDSIYETLDTLSKVFQENNTNFQICQVKDIFVEILYYVRELLIFEFGFEQDDLEYKINVLLIK